MGRKRAETLLALMERIERFTLARVWTDLTDEEFFWEPVANMWGIRRRNECTTQMPFGDGEWVADFGSGVEPMTTIGWLLWHIGSTPGRLVQVDFFGGNKTIASGWTSPYLTYHPVFTNAPDATEALRAGWIVLRDSLETADDEQLERPTPSYTYAPVPFRNGLAVIGEPGPASPSHVYVSAVLNEISHHGGQICALRDLYQWMPGVRAR